MLNNPIWGENMEYALAISAVKHIAVGSSIGEQTQITAAWTNRARSGAEAVGIGIELAKKTWPTSDGWFHHQCSECLIPREDYPQQRK